MDKWHWGRTDLPDKPSDHSPSFARFYQDILPPDGFAMPQIGDQVTCHRAFKTLVSGVNIPAGAVGEVLGYRDPRDPGETGYYGVIMRFQEIAYRTGHFGERRPVYSSGIVIPFDYAADPQVFSYAKAPAPAA